MERVVLKVHVHSDRYVGYFQVILTSVKEALTQEHELVKKLTKEWDRMKCSDAKRKETLKKAELEDNKTILINNILKKSLEATLFSKNNLEEDLSTSKNKMLDTSDQYLEWAKECVAFLYPNLDLSQIDLF